MRRPLGRQPKSEATRNRQPVQQAGRPPVYSYHSVRDSKLHEQTRSGSALPEDYTPPLWYRVLSFLGWTILVGVMLFELWLKPMPKATVVSVTGSVTRPQSDYQDGLRDIWGGSIFNRTKLTIQTDKLSREIKSRFPELASADVELPLLGQLPNVVLTPAQPSLLLVTQKGVFYLDSNGKTLSRTDEVSGNALGGLPTVRDDSGLVPEPGKNGLPKQTITTVTQLLRLAAAVNLDVDTLSLPAVPNEADMLLHGSNYTVKFALDADPRQGIGALTALRDKFKQDNIQPNAYVDLRVPDKAFYK